MTEVTLIALISAFALIVLQHVLITKYKDRESKLHNALADVAEGTAEVKLDADGDLCIRRTSRKAP